MLDHFMQKMEFQVEMPKYPQNHQYIVRVSPLRASTTIMTAKSC